MPRIDAAHDEHEKSENPHEERLFIEVGPHRSRRIERVNGHIDRPDDDTDKERAHEQATEETEQDSGPRLNDEADDDRQEEKETRRDNRRIPADEFRHELGPGRHDIGQSCEERLNELDSHGTGTHHVWSSSHTA